MSNIQNRISDLEKKVDSLRKYIIMRDGLWLEKRLDDIDKFLISYEQIGDEELILQLEFDNLMMCRSRLQDNFFEYCRRSVLQMEAFLGWALKKHENQDIGRTQKAWSKVQKSQEKRRSNYNPKKYPYNISNISAFNKLEISFTLFNKWSFEKLPKEKEKFWKFKYILTMRNIASHRDDKNNEIDQMNDKEKRLFESDKKYDHVADYMEDVRSWVYSHFEM